MGPEGGRMVNRRILLGIAATIVLTSALVGVTLLLVPSVHSPGGFRLPWQQPVQGDQPGVASIPANGSIGRDYVKATFRFDCEAAWCELPANKSMVFRIQQANHSEFQWEGLYKSGVRDGSTVHVALFVGQKYRLLLKHPDGRIIELANYTATDANGNVTLRLTKETLR